MKRILALTGSVLVVCALVCAQDMAGDRVVVPARDGARVRTVEASVIHGSIVVETGTSNEIVADVSGSHRGSSNTRTPPGMHRIDTPWNAPIRVEEDGDVVKLHLSPASSGETIHIKVPVNTSLKLNSVHGNVTVDGVHGEVDAESTHGDLKLSNISGTIVANTVHGTLKATMVQVDQSKPLSFTTMNGDVDVALPADVRTNIKLRTLHGEIWSDFEVRLTGSSPLNRSGGRYTISIDKAMNGTINGGGVQTSFYTINGKITIRKR